MPIPLRLVRLLIRAGIAQRLPSVRQLMQRSVNYLHHYSDGVLMAPNTEVAATGALFASCGDDTIDLAMGTPQLSLGSEPDGGPAAAANVLGGAVDARGYPPPCGLPELREAVARKLKRENGLQFSSSEVLITNGVCQGISMALDTFINPGDAVVLLDPSFMAYYYALRWQRARIRWVPTEVRGGELHFDVDRLDRAMKGAKMVIVNTPSNPTGACLAPESLETIVDAASGYDVLIFSDEVYERYLYDDRRFVSTAALAGARERTITANSFSKSYAQAGLRVGYLAGDEALMRPMLGTQFIRHPFVSTLCQRVAVRLLDQSEGFGPLLRRLKGQRRVCGERLANMGFESGLPGGAFYYWVDTSELSMNGREFARRLLDEQDVLVMPGNDFGPSGEQHIRVSYAGAAGKLDEGLARLATFVEQCRTGQGRPVRPIASVAGRTDAAHTSSLSARSGTNAPANRIGSD